MDPVETCMRYFQAWMRRDAGAVLETIAPGGTYQDPATPGPLAGEALRGYLRQLWAAFPDLGFELGRVHALDDHTVHGAWTMLGTNTGSLHGLPPTGRPVRLPGIDVIDVGSEGITRVTGYFDSALLPRQLGLDVVVQPKEAGPFRFGTASMVRRALPGVPQVLAFTELVAASDEGALRLRELGRSVALELSANEGLLGLTGAMVGRHLATVSAWSGLEQMQAAMRTGTHVRAMKEFFAAPDIEGGSTAVFGAQRVGPYYRRCGGCGRMATLAQPRGRCDCGAALEAVA